MPETGVGSFRPKRVHLLNGFSGLAGGVYTCEIKKKKTAVSVVGDRGFRRKSSLQAVRDTAILRVLPVLRTVPRVKQGRRKEGRKWKYLGAKRQSNGWQNRIMKRSNTTSER